MTVNEYRKEKPNCKYCEYCKFDYFGFLYCRAKYKHILKNYAKKCPIYKMVGEE